MKTQILKQFPHLDPNTIEETATLVDIPKLTNIKDVIGAFRQNGRVRVIRTYGHQDLREFNSGNEIIPKFSSICLNCQKKILKRKIYCNNSCSSSHSNKNRTPEVVNKIKSSIRLIQGKTTEQFIKESVLLYGVQEYNYSKTKYINSVIKVTLYHNKCRSSFDQSPSDHLRGHGCLNCNMSSGELMLNSMLSNNNIKFHTQWHFVKHPKLRGSGSSYFKFDFFLPDYNLAIEYDGRQHFSPIKKWGGVKSLLKTQQRDQIKNQFCLDNDIKLIRIPYWVKSTNIDILNLIDKEITVASFI